MKKEMIKKIKKRYFVLMAFVALVVLLSGCIETSRKTKPGAPSNLVGIAISHRGIQLTWQDNSDNEDGFRIASNIYGGNTYYEVGDVPANTTSATSSGFDPLETRKFYVQAYNDVGEANSNIVEVTTLSGVTLLNYALGEKWGDACITGQARNNTNEMLDYITITVWWYDAFDVLLDTDRDYASDVPAQTTWNFEVWGILVPRGDVARFEIEVTDVFIWSSSAKESEKEMRPESEWGLSGRQEPR